MTQKELFKEFDTKWKKENQTKYIAWLICYAGAFIPIIIILTQLFGKINDQKVQTIIILAVVWLVLELVAAVINVGKKKDWKEYLEQNKTRLGN